MFTNTNLFDTRVVFTVLVIKWVKCHVTSINPRAAIVEAFVTVVSLHGGQT